MELFTAFRRVVNTIANATGKDAGMQEDAAVELTRETAKTGVLVRLTGALAKLRADDPGGYDQYNNSGRWLQSEPDTATSPTRDESPLDEV